MSLYVFANYLLTANKAEVAYLGEEMPETEESDLFDKKQLQPLFHWAFWYLPRLYPNDWKIHDLFVLNKPDEDIKELVKDFFGIGDQEFNHLFVPMQQRCNIYGGTKLSFDAEPWEIGCNILHMLKVFVAKN